MPPEPAPPSSPLAALDARLAARLPDDAARDLLRALLATLEEGGSAAVRTAVRRRVQEILRDAG